eukprot:15467032-Alexandrium_andersonii.AAC.1
MTAQGTTCAPSYVGPLEFMLAAGRRGVSLPAGACACNLVFPQLGKVNVITPAQASPTGCLDLPSDEEVCALGPAALQTCD